MDTGWYRTHLQSLFCTISRCREFRFMMMFYERLSCASERYQGYTSPNSCSPYNLNTTQPCRAIDVFVSGGPPSYARHLSLRSNHATRDVQLQTHFSIVHCCVVGIGSPTIWKRSLGALGSSKMIHVNCEHFKTALAVQERTTLTPWHRTTVEYVPIP